MGDWVCWATAAEIARDRVAAFCTRSNAGLNMVSICGTTLSLTCSSSDAHHTQSPVIFCAEEQQLYLLLVLLHMLTIINLPLLLAQRSNVSISCFFFRRCSLYSISHYFLRRKEQLYLVHVLLQTLTILNLPLYLAQQSKWRLPSKYWRPRYLKILTGSKTSSSIRLGLRLGLGIRIGLQIVTCLIVWTLASILPPCKRWLCSTSILRML